MFNVLFNAISAKYTYHRLYRLGLIRNNYSFFEILKAYWRLKKYGHK